MTRAEAIDLCKNLKLFMEINDKLYANKFLESYHVALSMAINALREVSELQAINLDLASENENLLEQIQEMKAKAWIPVSERLPDEGYSVLVMRITDDNYKYMRVATYQGDCWMDDTDKFNKPNPHKVIAWMPLPKPYEGG